MIWVKKESDVIDRTLNLIFIRSPSTPFTVMIL